MCPSAGCLLYLQPSKGEKVTRKAGISDRKDVLVVGTGYLGKKVAQICRAANYRVFTTTRRQKRFPELVKSGFHPLHLDWTDRRTLGNLPLDSMSANTRVLVAVSYDRKSGLDRYQSQVGGLRNLLAILPEEMLICYISTTGVYHQTGGLWVDEASTTHPSRSGGKVHLLAEQELHRARPSASWNVLRLAGIYGPGRVPRSADVIAGRPIASPKSGFLNLIHVSDAARAVVASWRQMESNPLISASMQSRLYVVSDDLPVPRSMFYEEIARQCRVPQPSFVAPDPDTAVALRSASNKRVWNRKMKRELLPELIYPNYRAGLADVLADRSVAP